MAYTLKCNDDNFLGMDTLEVGDLNIFDPSSISPINPDGCYWHTIRSNGFNTKLIYNWLTANGYSVPTYDLNTTNVEQAKSGEHPEIVECFENEYYWLIGHFEDDFGIYFAIDGANRVRVKGYSYSEGSIADYGFIGGTTTAAVSEGTTDNIIYFVDYMYLEGSLWDGYTALPTGRYDVTVKEDLQREWYYYNNIDMVMINDTDSAFQDPINRKVPYFSNSNANFFHNRAFHNAAKNSSYRTKSDPNKHSGGSTQPDGGNGQTRTSVDIDHPTAPPDMLINSGIVKIFKPTAQQMNDFMNYIYSAPQQIATNFKKIWNDPMQSIIALSILPFDVPASDTTEIVKFVGQSTNVAMAPVTSQYYEVTIGDLTLPEETNSFLDYSSYTKVKAVLPFIGIVDMCTDDVMDATLNLKYIIDIESGDCVASIKCTKKRDAYGIDYSSALYSFNGNCISQAPLSSNNWQGLYSSGLRAATSIFTSLGSGNVAGAAISTGVDFLTSNKVDVKRSGSISGNSSHMGHYVPYIIVECPIMSTTTSMYERQGYPFNKLLSVEFMNDWKDPELETYGSGYTVFQKDSVFVDNINATDSEKQAIKNILESGVIFNPRPTK